jgi:hypothetical protein
VLGEALLDRVAAEFPAGLGREQRLALLAAVLGGLR